MPTVNAVNTILLSVTTTFSMPYIVILFITYVLCSSLAEDPNTVNDNRYELNLDVFANADISVQV